jgi:hypothetical protein
MTQGGTLSRHEPVGLSGRSPTADLSVAARSPHRRAVADVPAPYGSWQSVYGLF